jgi:hypothetical protein
MPQIFKIGKCNNLQQFFLHDDLIFKFKTQNIGRILKRQCYHSNGSYQLSNSVVIIFLIGLCLSFNKKNHVEKLCLNRRSSIF